MDRILKLQRQKVVLQSLKNQLSMKELFLFLFLCLFLSSCFHAVKGKPTYILFKWPYSISTFRFQKDYYEIKKALKIWNLPPLTGIDAKTNPYKPFWKLTGKKVEDKLILCKRRCSFWPAKMKIPFEFISRFFSVILII